MKENRHFRLGPGPLNDESIIPSVSEALHATENIIRHAEITQIRIKNTDVSRFFF